MDFIETVTLAGQRQYILAVIHHTGRRVRVLGTTAHATHSWITQAVRNLLMDLEDTGHLTRIRFLIRDRDAKYPALINEILGTAGIDTVPTGVRMPRMNSMMERWAETRSVELLDRVLIWNQGPPVERAARVRAARQRARTPPVTRSHSALASAAAAS